MSLSQALITNIEKVVETYINNISEKYNLDKDELVSLWTSGGHTSLKKTDKKPIENVDMTDISIERLHKCTKPELAALCKSKGYKCTGTKDVLINRLLGKEGGDSKETKDSKKEVKETKKETRKEVKETKKDHKVDVVKKLTSDIPVIPIRRNAYGNFEHPATRLIFDRKTESVIGKQQDDGTISELTDDDIESCKLYKFKYTLPDNLDKKETLENVKIDELESDIEVGEEQNDDEEVIEIDEDEGEEEIEYDEED
jgi:hypothetical protein